MIVDVVTIFPKMFKPVIGESIVKRAQKKGLVEINIHNLRDYSADRHKKVDFYSYGGGGMVFRPEPLFGAVEKILGYKVYPKKKKDPKKRIVLFSPKGKHLNQKTVKKFLKYERIILIAPRYEGVDERVRKNLADEEISVGDYIISGAELASMIFIDSLVRIIPGAISSRESVEQESFEGDLLDFPHYTKPRDFRGLKVPKVLFSGNHQKIAQWRRHKAIETTKKIRPDLWKSFCSKK
ncbi:MAG: tRNA (guanosine(37)-N1)-methyltransferase TrmD [Candidatus Omnitrophica bacterium]|nr:tRNA (guanosine(37)-N1)-methyltransferase TrmD [Candidatus Omnitrophota bacterium]